ncbi:MAG: hypothetical protein H7Z15_15615 [Rhizobacter sp.]|nr:hypothetical protein [Rhizobacter sp.]
MQVRALVSAGALCLLAACGGGDEGDAAPQQTPSGADVSITAAGPVTVMASGSLTTIEVIVSNAGPATARNVAVAANLGAALTRTAVTCAASGGATCPASPASMSVPSLPVNGSLRYVVSAAIASGTRGAVASSITVSADNDSATTNNSAAPVINAYVADLVVSGTGPATPVSGGGTAVYAMSVTNTGPDAAANVQMDSIVGAGQSLRSVTCTSSAGAVCPATPGASMVTPSVPVGGTLSFTVTADVAATMIGNVANTLYVSPAGDPVQSNNVVTVSSPAVIPSAGQSFIQLQSDAGDWVGQGRSYSYTKANAVLTVTTSGNRLTVGVNGDEWWNASFQTPGSSAQLQPGTYAASRFGSTTFAGLDWGGEGRGCNSIEGTLVVDSVSYVAGALSSLDLHFEQHCEGGGPALRGQVHWVASDTTAAAGPVSPVPSTLWRAPAGATPTSGNYVYLQSDGGDFIGAGRTATYTQAEAALRVSVSNGLLQVGVGGDDDWTGDFQAMNSLSTLQPGLYSGLQRYPFHNPTLGGLSWSGNGRGCNTLTGWFVIDSITYAGNALASVDLRFEQHCEGGAAALRGQIHWVAGDPTAPPGPLTPLPAGLWNAPAGATPASGNYVYLQSDAGDFIGGGQTYLYTPGTATVSVTGSGRQAQVNVNGGGGWSANFVGMNSIAQLTPGYYGNLQRWPFHNAAKGGMNWSGNGRGCNTLSGWFVIDSISFASGNIASIDLRFEQHCEGGGPALRGKIHWVN